MPSLYPTLPITAAVILIAMFTLWIVATAAGVSIVDPFWGFGFVIVAVVAWRLNAPASGRVLLLVGLTAIWGVRLSAFLVWRNKSHGEDRRYAAMRTRHGASFWWVSFFTVFLLQGAVLLWIISLPIQFTAIWNRPSPLGWLDAIGVGVWVVGFFFEAVGDWQLARFKRDPRNAGRVLDEGLWRYTRHPNYFGDFCVWWGVYFIATAGGAWATLFSPILMSWLLLKVSGVTLLEQTITDRRPEYAAYQKLTNAFFPGPK